MVDNIALKNNLLSIQSRSSNYRTRTRIMWLIIFSIALPKGIGPYILGINIDATKILLILSVLFTASIQLNKSLRVKSYSLFLWLIVAACLSFSGYWLSSTQYLFFAYYVLVYVSAFWVSSFLFRDSAFFVKFTNNLAVVLIMSGLLALLDYRFNFIPFEYLRPENEAFIHGYSRGGVFGSLEIVAYKGFDSVTSWFAVDRFVWLSWGVIAYVYSLKEPKWGLKSDILLVATMIGVLEIILSQARVMSMFALLLFMFILAVSLTHKRGRKIYALGFVALLVAAIVMYHDYVVYFLKNVYSILNFHEIEWLQSNLSYSFEVDKRGQALTAITEHFGDTGVYLLPPGPLFYNFTEWFLDVPSEYFDDLTPVITSVFEIGFVPWMMVLSFVVYAVAKKKDKIGQIFVLILAMVFISSIGVFTPRFYYYIFFVLGALLSRSVRYEMSSRTSNSMYNA